MNLAFSALNVFATPHPLNPQIENQLPLIHNWGDLRDYFFRMDQVVLPEMIGSISGIVALYMLVRLLLFRRSTTRWQKRFWLIFLAASLILGAAAVPYKETFGSGHVIAQPLALMGIVLVAAAALSRQRWLAGLIAIGCMLDYAMGILLHFNRESLVYQMISTPDGFMPRPDALLGSPISGPLDYARKLSHGFTFWGDHAASAAVFLQIASVAFAMIALFVFLRLPNAAQK